LARYGPDADGFGSYRRAVHRSSDDSAQRTAIAKGDQAWADGVRDDLAALIAHHTQLVAFRKGTPFLNSDSFDIAAATLEVDRLMHRVRLRLDLQHPAERELDEAIMTFAKSEDMAQASTARVAIVTIFDRVTKQVLAAH
jgi:hypothetical protein